MDTDVNDHRMNEVRKPQAKTYEVTVSRTISTTVRVTADSPEHAYEQVNSADFPLPPVEDWSGHKDWRYLVEDSAGTSQEFE